MNRMHQIHVGLLTSMMVAACLATENKPFYEVFHKPQYIFDVEDYHADIVLGMLPYIKSSIKDFRKRNFTNNDIENMYQTLTIFWPVIRKYLHLKEEFVDNNSYEDEEKNKQNSLPFSPYSSSSENINILIKDNVEFDNAQTRKKIVQSQISQSAPVVYKRDQPISSKIELKSTSTNKNQGVISNPDTSVSTPSMNNQNINRRNYVARFKSIRDSLPMSDDNRPEIANPETSILTPSNNKQNTNRGNLFKMKGIRESSPLSNDEINIQSNFQSARTKFSKNNSVNGRPFKSISNKSFSTTTTERPSRIPFNRIGSNRISITEETPHKITSTTPFSYTTRRPYKRTLKLLNQDSISPAIVRLIQSTGTTATKNNSENGRPYLFIRNESFSANTRRPSRKPSKLASQDAIFTTEDIATLITVSKPVFSVITTRRPSRKPSKPLRQNPISTQEERPSTGFYHKLLNNAALRLLQTATNTPATGNISKSTRIADRSKSTNKAGRPKSTINSTPVPDSTNNHPITTTPRTAIRFKTTRTADRSISTTKSTPFLASAIISTESKLITNSSPQVAENGNSATDRGGVTDTSPVETLKPPVNGNMFYYPDLSSIMRALGNPIDVSG